MFNRLLNVPLISNASKRLSTHALKHCKTTRQNLHPVFLAEKVNLKSGNLNCDTLHDLVPFVQFKKRKKHPACYF